MPQNQDTGPTGHRKRLRQRYLSAGLAGLQDYEVLELLLTYTISRRDVKPIAKALLQRFKTLSALLEAKPAALRKVPGIGEKTTAFLKLVKDAAHIIAAEQITRENKINGVEDVIDYVKTYFKGKKNEEFFIFYLDNQHHLVHHMPLFKGTIDRVDIYKRRIIEEALSRDSNHLIIVHNHPGGTVSPSRQDEQLTFDLALSLRAIDGQLLDHIIVADNLYYSFAAQGIMTRIHRRIDTFLRNHCP